MWDPYRHHGTPHRHEAPHLHGERPRYGVHPPAGRGSSCGTAQWNAPVLRHDRLRRSAECLVAAGPVANPSRGASAPDRGPDHHGPAHGPGDRCRRRHQPMQRRPRPVPQWWERMPRSGAAVAENAAAAVPATAQAAGAAAAGSPSEAETTGRQRHEARPFPTGAPAECRSEWAAAAGSTVPWVAAGLFGKPSYCSAAAWRAHPRPLER